ncbi:MAG: hypothetical protein H7Y38_13535 [Armatimonadetes bacterium]|nr:hypothetical protein [Armatimonadota bacterium]
MRCYKKPFSWELVADEIRWDYGALPFDRQNPPASLYFVHVCGFRFVFVSLAQIGEYRAFYDQPLKPSFRWGDAKMRYYNDNGEAQTPFARLPLYLWQKAKRVKVVRGLERAIRDFAKD